MYNSDQYTPESPPIITDEHPQCIYGDTIVEDNINVLTKIETYKNSNNQIKINNKLKEFIISETGSKYSQNIQRLLEDPSPVELSTIQESLRRCSLTEEPASKYYLCKYEVIGNRTLSEYINERPNIQRILDQYDQILKAISTLSEQKKLIHYAIKNENIIVKEVEDIPIITNFKTAILAYDEETNIENFNTILQEATEIHCLEAHILVYIGKKKDGISIEQWKTTIYDNDQHTEATANRSQTSQHYPEYLNLTYEELYREIMKTFSKWDIYSVTVMLSQILQEIQDPNIQNLHNSLIQLLSKKTIELTNSIPKLERITTEVP
jgi:serine/threonine protein kinase